MGSRQTVAKCDKEGRGVKNRCQADEILFEWPLYITALIDCQNGLDKFSYPRAIVYLSCFVSTITLHLSFPIIFSLPCRWRSLRITRRCRTQPLKLSEDNCPSLGARLIGLKSSATRSELNSGAKRTKLASALKHKDAYTKLAMRLSV